MRTITIRGALLVKMKNFIAENASFQGYFTEVCFDTSEGNQLSYFRNGYFFKILGDFMMYIIGQNAGEKNKILFSNFHKLISLL